MENTYCPNFCPFYYVDLYQSMGWRTGIAPLGYCGTSGVLWHIWGTAAQTLLKLTHGPFPIVKEHSERSMAATLSRECGDVSRILFS